MRVRLADRTQILLIPQIRDIDYSIAAIFVSAIQILDQEFSPLFKSCVLIASITIHSIRLVRFYYATLAPLIPSRWSIWIGLTCICRSNLFQINI